MKMICDTRKDKAGAELCFMFIMMSDKSPDFLTETELGF